MPTSGFSRLQDHNPEPASPKRSRPVEEEAVDILLRMDEDETGQPGPVPGGLPNKGKESPLSQLGSVKAQKAEETGPENKPTARPSDVARRLLKQAALLKRRT
jgi:hypothetical protein